MADLSHLDEKGQVRMVNVGAKPATPRKASAEAIVKMSPQSVRLIGEDQLPKGEALAAARLAGILAGKQTPILIPLCHPIPLSAIDVECSVQPDSVRIVARVSTTAATGPEMEAMTAAAVAALTLYDMVKGVDRRAEILHVRLLEKAGGKSGHWKRPDVGETEQDAPR